MRCALDLGLRSGEVARLSLDDIDWDRDIGQQQWGVTLVIRKNRREEKRRLYIHRDKKGAVEGAFERFRPQLQEAETVAA